MREQYTGSVWFHAELCGKVCESPEWSCTLPAHLDTIYFFPRSLTFVSHIFRYTFPLVHSHLHTLRTGWNQGVGIKPFQISRLALPLLLVLVRLFPLLPASPPHRRASVLGLLVSRALRQELCSVTRGGLQASGPSLYLEARPGPVSNNGLPIVLYKVSW